MVSCGSQNHDLFVAQRRTNMPGIVYRALSKTTYDFSATAAGKSTTYIVAKGIDVSQYREGTLIVRIHPGGSFTGGAPSFTVNVYADAPTPEDPASDGSTRTR